MTRQRPVALVTGAARRVGRVVARELAERGYDLALHAHRSASAARQLAGDMTEAGGTAIAVLADLAAEAEVRAMVGRVHGHFGRIDAVINSAAVWSAKPLEDVRAHDVQDHFSVNTLGTFVCCQEAGLIMVGQAEGGAIVNVGDWAVVRPYPGYSAYFPSKGAVPAMTRSLAVELGLRNPKVRVNAVLPGPVMLPEGTSDAEREAIVRSTLVGRLGRPEDLAHAVRFLLENEFITGVCLPVDGGRSVYAGETAGPTQ